MAHNHRRLGQNLAAEKVLYGLISQKRQASVNPALVYDDYDTLFKHFLTYDLEKAIKLAKALLQYESSSMPNSHIKLFNFNLGNAFLMAGNYSDAKVRLRNCLESDPQGALKVFAFNNLGLCCWWHKNPLESRE